MECKYGHASPEGSRFCNTCGAPIAVIVPTTPNPEAHSELNSSDGSKQDWAELFNPSAKRPWYKSKVAIGLLILFVILSGRAAIFGASGGGLALSSESPSPTADTGFMSRLNDNVDIKAAELAACPQAQTKATELGAIYTKYIESIDSYKGSTSDARKAEKFLSEKPFSISERYLQTLNGALLAMTVEALKVNFKSDLDTEQQNALLQDLISICDVESQKTGAATIASQIEIADALDKKVIQVTGLAASVPWYPDGFTEFDANIAYKYNKGGCDYFRCHNVSVISRTACSLMYAEMTLLDSSGANVGFSNDTASSVQPNQIVKLRFDVIEDSASQGQLTQVTCG